MVAGNRGCRSGRWRCRFKSAVAHRRDPSASLARPALSRPERAWPFAVDWRVLLARCGRPVLPDLGTARRVNPEPKDPRGGSTWALARMVIVCRPSAPRRRPARPPSATRSVPARAASSEGCGVQNSRMAEAMASSRSRSSSVLRAALLWPERVTTGAAFEQVDGGPAIPTDGATSSTRRCDGRTAPRRRYISGFADTGVPSTSGGLMGVRGSGSGPSPPAGTTSTSSRPRTTPLGPPPYGSNYERLQQVKPSMTRTTYSA